MAGVKSFFWFFSDSANDVWARKDSAPRVFGSIVPVGAEDIAVGGAGGVGEGRRRDLRGDCAYRAVAHADQEIAAAEGMRHARGVVDALDALAGRQRVEVFGGNLI